MERGPAEGPENSLQRVQAFDRTRWVVDRGRQRADNHVDDAPNRERRILEQAAVVREEQPAPGLALIDQAPAPDDRIASSSATQKPICATTSITASARRAIRTRRFRSTAASTSPWRGWVTTSATTISNSATTTVSVSGPSRVEPPMSPIATSAYTPGATNNPIAFLITASRRNTCTRRGECCPAPK